MGGGSREEVTLGEEPRVLESLRDNIGKREHCCRLLSCGMVLSRDRMPLLGRNGKLRLGEVEARSLGERWTGFGDLHVWGASTRRHLLPSIPGVIPEVYGSPELSR